MRAPIAARRLEIIGQFAAKAAAHVTRDDAHILFRDVESASDTFLRTLSELRGDVQRELRTLPHRHSCVRFHRRLVLIGGGVSRIDPHRRAGKGAAEIADCVLRRLVRTKLTGIDRGCGCRVQTIVSFGGRIADPHHRGGGTCLLERFGDNEGDGEPEIRHLVVIKCGHRARETVRQIDGAERMLRRGIVLREDEAHAGRIARLLHINGGDTAFADRCGNDDPTERSTLRGVFIGIRRPAGHFQAAIDAVEGKTDRRGELDFSHVGFPQMLSVASARVARRVRRASGILKLLWP
jgi:hypothetical protein